MSSTPWLCGPWMGGSTKAQPSGIPGEAEAVDHNGRADAAGCASYKGDPALSRNDASKSLFDIGGRFACGRL